MTTTIISGLSEATRDAGHKGEAATARIADTLGVAQSRRVGNFRSTAEGTAFGESISAMIGRKP